MKLKRTSANLHTFLDATGTEVVWTLNLVKRAKSRCTRRFAIARSCSTWLPCCPTRTTTPNSCSGSVISVNPAGFNPHFTFSVFSSFFFTFLFQNPF